MTKDFLEGKIDALAYSLDFPYEVEIRYRKMVKEDKVMAEYIFDCLVEDGAYLFNSLGEEAFREKILRHYKYIYNTYSDEDIISVNGLPYLRLEEEGDLQMKAYQ